MKKENSIKEVAYDEDDMPSEIDFSKGIKNPYAKLLKQQVTINLAYTVIEYFKEQAKETGIPYQSLINLYLMSVVEEKKKLKLTWK